MAKTTSTRQDFTIADYYEEIKRLKEQLELERDKRFLGGGEQLRAGYVIRR